MPSANKQNILEFKILLGFHICGSITQKISLSWHIQSGSKNHHNFTGIASFCDNFISRQSEIEILDYGGGGGQFALILKSKLKFL